MVLLTNCNKKTECNQKSWLLVWDPSKGHNNIFPKILHWGVKSGTSACTTDLRPVLSRSCYRLFKVLGLRTVTKITLNISGNLQVIDIVGSTLTSTCIWASPDIALESILTCPRLPLKAEVPGDYSFMNFWMLSIHPTNVRCPTDFFKGSCSRCKGPWWLGCQVCTSFTLEPVPTFGDTILVLRKIWLVTVVRTSWG